MNPAKYRCGKHWYRGIGLCTSIAKDPTPIVAGRSRTTSRSPRRWLRCQCPKSCQGLCFSREKNDAISERHHMIDAPKLGWRRREQKQAPCLLHDADLANSSWHVRAFETSILVSNLTNSVPVRRNTCTSDCESTLAAIAAGRFLPSGSETMLSRSGRVARRGWSALSIIWAWHSAEDRQQALPNDSCCPPATTPCCGSCDDQP